MNRRERFIQTMTFGTPDVPASADYFAYQPTYDRWVSEELPRGTDLNAYFGMDFDPFTWKVPVAWPFTLMPDFGEVVLEKNADYIVTRQASGEVVKTMVNVPPPAMPQFLRYPIESRAQWEEHRRRLDPDTPARIPAALSELARNSPTRDYPLGLWVGGTYGFMRNWWGVENLSLLFFDDPALIEEMIEWMTHFSLRMFDRVLATGVKLDWVMFWEDLAYKTGPLISPAMFRKYCLPYYEKVMAKVRSAGIPVAMVDSDGNIEEIIPLWLEMGVNIMHPMEVAAGMDVLKIRKKYGKQIGFFGGIDKRVLATTREAIRAAVIPILEGGFAAGGFIPACDHGIPPDVSFANYRYYRELVAEVSRKMCG
jgi:uroporphyrinogen decarboxylase